MPSNLSPVSFPYPRPKGRTVTCKPGSKTAHGSSLENWLRKQARESIEQQTSYLSGSLRSASTSMA
jgi:hypothetical protein